MCFSDRRDAEIYILALKERLKKFGLEVAEDKTKVIEFGRRAWKLSREKKEKVATFTFFGFTHYCTASRTGRFVMGHKTSKESQRKGLKAIKVFIKGVKSKISLTEIWRHLKPRIIGHYNYFAV